MGGTLSQKKLQATETRSKVNLLSTDKAKGRSSSVSVMNAASQTGNGTSSRMSKSRSVQQCNKGTGRVKAAKNQKSKTKISKKNSYKNLKQKLTSISEAEVTENKEHPKNYTKNPLTIATWNVTSLVSNTSKNDQLATALTIMALTYSE